MNFVVRGKTTLNTFFILGSLLFVLTSPAYAQDPPPWVEQLIEQITQLNQNIQNFSQQIMALDEVLTEYAPIMARIGEAESHSLGQIGRLSEMLYENRAAVAAVGLAFLTVGTVRMILSDPIQRCFFHERGLLQRARAYCRKKKSEHHQDNQRTLLTGSPLPEDGLPH